MAPFRWPKVDQDIAFCKEVIARRPTKPDDWEDIAEFLSNLFTTENNPVQIKGRGCRERSELLVKKYKSEERKALKRSGTEEEFGELNTLLGDIATYLEDMTTNVVSKQKKKEEEDRSKGLAMRKAAMETYAKNSKSDSSSQPDEKEEDEELFFPGCSKKTKRGRTGSSQMLNYLSKKHENSMQIKERRLNLEERKLQLEEKKMALEEMKWKMMMSCHANTQNDLCD
ncbi:uncharacterized protein LOC141877388 [Acropora palmata]|uniref:uncharacterized protein LOC141877388 n=1 Tax=Acropora palmata TaxID=6131 RepID=UPI003DA0CF07